MDKQQLEAIRARDADYNDVFEAQASMSKDIAHRLVAWPVADRHALLAAYDALAARLAEVERANAEWLKANGPGGWIDDLRSRLAEAERNEETLLGMIRHQRDVLRECLPYINESMAGRRPGRCADDIRAAVKALTADSASVVQYKPCEICTTQSWCETHGCQCYPVSAVQPERCCLDYPRCDCNSPPEPDNAPALQPCGHPWKAQHDFKCILCSSPG